MSTILESVLLLTLIALVAVKTVHFVRAIRKKRVIDWFYFSRYRIILSSTSQSARAKRMQNAFTVGIGAVLLVLFFVFYLQILAVI